MASFSFNASSITPKTSYDPIPAGWYLAQVTDSGVNPSKSGKGMRMSLTFDILEGQFKGRKIFAGLNVQHENPEVERISQEQLGTLMHAIGVIDLQDTAQLHMKPVMIKVKVREAKDGYDASNDVSGYKKSDIVAPTGGGAPAAANAALPPWQKRAA